MNFKQLLADDDAVSPVIGVILMVAITVILAAVIGTFVLGLGDQVQTTAPNTNVAFDYSENHDAGAGENDTLEIEHTGGDGIPGDELNVVASGAQNATDGYSSVSQSDESLFAGYDTVRAGDAESLEGAHFNGIGSTNGELALNASEVRVVWRGEGDRSSTLRTWSGPDA